MTAFKDRLKLDGASESTSVQQIDVDLDAVNTELDSIDTGVGAAVTELEAANVALDIVKTRMVKDMLPTQISAWRAENTVGPHIFKLCNPGHSATEMSAPSSGFEYRLLELHISVSVPNTLVTISNGSVVIWTGNLPEGFGVIPFPMMGRGFGAGGIPRITLSQAGQFYAEAEFVEVELES